MQLKKCSFCGKMFSSYGSTICPLCMEEMDQHFSVVRDYLYDYPNASIEQVCEATEVDEKVVMHLLRDGRIRMVEATGLLKCEQCGTPIDSGRYCATCSNTLESRITKATLERMAQKPRGPRMHTSSDK